ncbi:chemotaxis protein CheW [Legionella yabuuchiae]|uniref:chemotaxis protein CheW n=1 Tax=Legionella yabuuchiae TaxID=376727 RepID=UPI0013EF8352|nr:chemotaxis protein CheW [Legionella yabuuchiae]
MTNNQQGGERQVVIFRLQTEEFGVDIQQVREIVPMMTISRLPNAADPIKGVINLRGRVIPVINLKEPLGLLKSSELDQANRIVVVEVDNTTIGLLVDDVPEILKLPEKKIQPTSEIIKQWEQVSYIKEVGKLGERLIIILNLSELITIPEPQILENPSYGETHE